MKAHNPKIQFMGNFSLPLDLGEDVTGLYSDHLIRDSYTDPQLSLTDVSRDLDSYFTGYCNAIGFHAVKHVGFLEFIDVCYHEDSTTDNLVIFVLEAFGKVHFQVEDEIVHLRPGQVFSFSDYKMHCVTNVSGRPCRLITCETGTNQ